MKSNDNRDFEEESNRKNEQPTLKIVLRGLTPPHRVKSISMATFSQDEIDYLKAHGNDACAKTWLGLWDPKRAVHQDQRELMIDKYERKRYYLEPASPLKSLTNAASLKSNSTAAPTTPVTNDGDVHKMNGYATINGQHKAHNALDTGGFQLNPPSVQHNTAQRTTVNGLQHKTAIAGTTAISRPQHSLQNGYHNDKNKTNNNLNNFNKTNQLQQNAFVMHSSQTKSNSNALHMPKNGIPDNNITCAPSNGFGADADFVADFGSANIFDSTAKNVTNNGYAKIHVIKAAQQQKQQQSLLNGHAHMNGTANNVNGNTENFADFEHAPIFQAKENFKFVRKQVIKRCAGGQQNINSNKEDLVDIDSVDTFNEKSVISSSTSAPIPSCCVASVEMALAQQRQGELSSRESMRQSARPSLRESVRELVRESIHQPRPSIRPEERKSFDPSRKSSLHLVLDIPSETDVGSKTRSFSQTDLSRPTTEASLLVSQESGAISANESDGRFVPQQKSSRALIQEDINQTPLQDDSCCRSKPCNTLGSCPLVPHTKSCMHQLQASASSAMAKAAHATAMNVLSESNKQGPTNQRIRDMNGFFAWLNPSRAEYPTCVQRTPTYYSSQVCCPQSSSCPFLPPTSCPQSSSCPQPQQPISQSDFSPFNPQCFTYPPTSQPPQPPQQPCFCPDPFDHQSVAALSYTPIPVPRVPAAVQSNAACQNRSSSDGFDTFCTLYNNSYIPPPPNAYAPPQRIPEPSSFMLNDCPEPCPPPIPCIPNQFPPTSCPPTSCPPASCPLPEQSAAPLPQAIPPTSQTSYPIPAASSYPAPQTTYPGVQTYCPASYCQYDCTGPYCYTNYNTYPCFPHQLLSMGHSLVDSAYQPSQFSTTNYTCCDWSLPIPNSKAMNANNNNSTSNLSTTPGEDRYAALKDLDEQIRESKAAAAIAAAAAAATANTSYNLDTYTTNNVNPFNHLQQQQQQQAQQLQPQQHMVNPFQGTQNLFGQITVIPQSNGLPQTAAPSAAPPYYNYTNGGFNGTSVNGGSTMYSTPTVMSGGPNGCGFGCGAGTSGGTFNNPFTTATGTLNANNPFL